ncbi:hypothetical protein B0I21_106133 [Sphingobacterium paludis]|uniref:Uncharacterized protein n=1 Tax=Sphingobacterium paludis TaxID=1476465 RepID=A0A4R7D0J2_9SPHI|nr:hypothetical protein B0I21_106133 [Sphingobacterium paludis]
MCKLSLAHLHCCHLKSRIRTPHLVVALKNQWHLYGVGHSHTRQYKGAISTAQLFCVIECILDDYL